MAKWIGRLLIAAACVVVLVAAFRQHWAVGLPAVAALVGTGLYAGRASLYAFRGNAAYANDKLHEAAAGRRGGGPDDDRGVEYNDNDVTILDNAAYSACCSANGRPPRTTRLARVSSG